MTIGGGICIVSKRVVQVDCDVTLAMKGIREMNDIKNNLILAKLKTILKIQSCDFAMVMVGDGQG